MTNPGPLNTSSSTELDELGLPSVLRQTSFSPSNEENLAVNETFRCVHRKESPCSSSVAWAGRTLLSVFPTKLISSKLKDCFSSHAWWTVTDLTRDTEAVAWPFDARGLCQRHILPLPWRPTTKPTPSSIYRTTSAVGFLRKTRR